MSTTADPASQAFIFTTASGTTIPDPSPNSMTRARTRLEAPENVPVPASLFPVRVVHLFAAPRATPAEPDRPPPAPDADRRAPRDRRGRARRQAAQVHGGVTAPSRPLPWTSAGVLFGNVPSEAKQHARDERPRNLSSRNPLSFRAFAARRVPRSTLPPTSRRARRTSSQRYPSAWCLCRTPPPRRAPPRARAPG